MQRTLWMAPFESIGGFRGRADYRTGKYQTLLRELRDSLNFRLRVVVSSRTIPTLSTGVLGRESAPEHRFP